MPIQHDTSAASKAEVAESSQAHGVAVAGRVALLTELGSLRSKPFAWDDAAHTDQPNNPLKNAPHTLAMITAEQWELPYTRTQAAFPLDYLQENKFWPSVRRVDDAYGDRNLICTCTPIEAYA